MAWQNPFFCFLHAWRDAGASALTPNSTASGFAVARVIDDQQGPLFKWNAAAANNEIVVDRGGGSLENCDRLIIPATHNLSGKTVELETNTADTWPGTSRVSVVAGAGIINESFTATNHRWHRLRVTESFQGELGEVFVTRDRTLTRGPEPDWVDEFIPNILETVTRSRNHYRVLAGSEQRHVVYEFLRMSGADKTVFDDMRTELSGGLRPLFLFTADSTAVPVYMQLADRTKRKQDSRAPRALGERFAISLDLLEVLQ